MKTIVFRAFVLCLGSVPGFAQLVCPPVLQWQKSFGTPGYEYATAVEETADGGFIVGGSSSYFPVARGNKTSPDYGGRDFWIVRTDADGNKLWDRAYGGSSDDTFETLGRTADGGFILGGSSWYDSWSGNKTSTNYGLSDFWVVRTDAAGTLVWDRSFGGSNFDFLADVQQTRDGGFVLIGSSSSGEHDTKSAPNLGGDDFWVVRLDADGNRLWDRTYGGDIHDRASAIRQTADGGFILGGTVEDFFFDYEPGGFGMLDYLVIRIDANGNQLWQRVFGGSERDQLQSIALTPDGGCLVGGWSRSEPSGNKTSPNYGFQDYWIVRLDAAGNKLWERSYGGSYDDVLESVSANSDGSFLLAGYSGSEPGGSKTAPLLGGNDYWVIRIDASGNQVWERTLGGENYDSCHAAHQTADGGYILAGEALSMGGDRQGRGFGSDDYWLVKLAPENPNDCDHDGVPNDQDVCEETPLGSIVNAQGCSVHQLCHCDYETHEGYVACVREAARAFQRAGLISSPHARQLIESARVAACPPSAGPGEAFVFGLSHRPIRATLDLHPSWFDGILVLPEDGDAVPPYGMSVSLGEADSGLFIYPHGGQNNYGESWFFDAKAYGHNGREDGQLISSVTVNKPNYESYPVRVDLSPLHPDSVTIQVFSNRTLIAEAMVPGGLASFHIWGAVQLEPRGNPFWRMPDGSVGAIIQFTSPYVFRYEGGFAISGPWANEPGQSGIFEGVRGDTIFVRADRPRRGVLHVSRVDAVAGGGIWSFQVLNERLGMFEHAHQALGPVVFNPANGRLHINAMEPLAGDEFAGVLVEAADAASRLEVDLQPVALEEPGAGLVAYPAGVMDLGSFVFGEVRISRAPDELSLRCDYQILFDAASSNTPLVRLEVLRNGRPAGTAVFSNPVVTGSLTLRDGRAPQITGWRATINSNGIPTLGFSLAQVTTFTGADGVALTGNHLRITPVNPTYRVRSMSTITLEMVRQQTLAIIAERSTLLPPALSIQPASGALVVRWSDNTRLFSLESAMSLSGPFTAVTNEVQLVNNQTTVTLPASHENSRFFRLTAPAD